MAQKFDARQTISRDVLSQLLGINGTELDDLLRAINKEFNAPLRISASSPADSKINFQPSEVEAADLAAKNITPISSQIPSFVASTIDFQTGATTGGTINITFPNSTVGFFRRIGFSLDASGTIQAIFSAEAASLGALANAGTVFVKGALPIGWIDLEATAASPGRFKTAGSATNIIEHKVSGSNRVHRIMGGGGTSTGSGSGTGDDINALTFKASFTDLFSDLPTDSVSAVDYTSGKTDSTTYDIVNTYHRLAYDATRLLSGTGTAMTLNIAPSFTIKIGDMVIFGSEARRISALSSQTSFTIESAFSTNPSSSACTLSQAVYSKDLNNFAGDGIAVSTAFSTNISQILMTYEDTSAANDTIFDANAVAVIGYTASSDGTNFTNVNVRPQNLSDSQSIVNLPTSGTNLYVRMFANKSSGAGSVNILGYKVFFHRDLVYADGSAMNQAYARTDGSGTQVNISAISVVGGKTRIKTSFSFPVAVNSGKSNGSIKVYLDGQKLPRFVDATVSITGYYKEIDQNTIELDADYSSMALECEIIQDVAVVDASDTNTTNVAQLQETLSEGTQGFVKNSLLLAPTTTTGTPATGTFYSTIPNRASIFDLSQDLKARMGIERFTTQIFYQIQKEAGPNGEPVWGFANDVFDQLRLVGGSWSYNGATNNGPDVSTTSTTDYIEIVFYGTGLNLINLANSTRDYRASVDGGAEGSNLLSGTGSAVINGRNYNANIVIPVTNNLPLGIHTVKIRNNSSTGMNCQGFEILNEASTIKVQPGSSYLAGKKLTTSAQQSLAYNSSFESGTLGTKGGRVVVYQKADGSVAKAVQPAAASPTLFPSAVDHSNEEMYRQYYWREFGAGRTDDFSLLTTSVISTAFTLDDGTTTLTGNSVLIDSNVGNNCVTGGNGSYITLTFVGTGVDVVLSVAAATNARSIQYAIDGGSLTTITTTTNVQTLAPTTFKLASGLPYGTHTLKLFNNVGTGNMIGVSYLKVYQPKKPSIPSGCVELADYNVMADYVANSTAGIDTVATGILKKANIRETFYVGSWAIGAPSAAVGNASTGVQVFTATNADYYEYTFFGTGLELRYSVGAGGTDTATISMDGLTFNTTNFPSQAAAATTYGASSSFASGTGVLTAPASAIAHGLRITGLTLGKHTIRVTKSSGAGNFFIDSFDVITPIYSSKSNSYFDFQNTLNIGSNALSDNRKISLIEESNLQQAQVSQAYGFQVATTTSTVYVPVPDLSVTHKSVTGKIQISWAASTTGGGANAADLQVQVNGVSQGPSLRGAGLSGSVGSGVGNCFVINVGPGVHKVDLLWLATGGTMTLVNGRSLTVRDV